MVNFLILVRNLSRMPKFIIFNDPHYTETPPRMRKDTYGADILSKIDEVILLSEQHNCDAILCTGDIFHRKGDVTHSEVFKLMSVLKKAKVPILTILGNHDIIGYNFDSYKTRAIGTLIKSDIIKLLDSKEYRFDNVVVSGKSYNNRYDQPGSKSYYLPYKKLKEELSIHLTHGMLMFDKAFPFGGSTTLEQIKDTDCDVIINGHYHTRLGISKTGKCQVFALGSII